MPVWIDFQNIKKDDLSIIENTAKIPHDLLETKLLNESFPRIDSIGNILTVFLWDSQMHSDNLSSKGFNISTNNMLIAFNEDQIITLSRGESNLFNKISRDLSNEISNRPFKENEFTDKILYSLLQQKMIDYSEIVRRIEQKTIEFEEIPVGETSPQFLEGTFRFKKEILKVSSNLWHFQNVLRQLIDEKTVAKFKIDNKYDFDYLNEESGYLYETTQNIKESLISLIELHTNTVSYDMNRVMKVIAVITCLAIIPSIIGGLLGVNLIEGNFPIKLTEIFFIVFSLMLLGLYAFYKMDWLK
jgi:Mg2+ and Co2+ transporter CorA